MHTDQMLRKMRIYTWHLNDEKQTFPRLAFQRQVATQEVPFIFTTILTYKCNSTLSRTSKNGHVQVGKDNTVI